MKENLNSQNVLEERLALDEGLQKELKQAMNEEAKNEVMDQLDQEEARSVTNGAKVEMKELFTLKSHLDNVRGLKFIDFREALVSISEDCSVKLWNIDEIIQNNGQVEPYITLRGHTGPIFSIESRSTRMSIRFHANEDKTIVDDSAIDIFTGGCDGILKAWLAPARADITPYGPTNDGCNYCIASW